MGLRSTRLFRLDHPRGRKHFINELERELCSESVLKSQLRFGIVFMLIESLRKLVDSALLLV